MNNLDHLIRRTEGAGFAPYEDFTPHSPYSPRVYGAIAALVLLAGYAIWRVVAG